MPSGSLLGGTKTNNTLRDASLGGASAVMTRLAERIEKEIEDNGFYTRVPAGKQFYLYVQQTINPNDWEMGTSLSKEPKENNASLLEETNTFIDKIAILKDTLNH